MTDNLVLTAPEARQISPMDMMAQVLRTQNPKDAVEVVKELAKLQMEMRKQDAEVEFNKALADASSEMKLVINDSDKTAPGGKRWATYKALNNAAKPIWIRHGLGVSYDAEPSPVPDQMFMVAHVSKGLHTRKYMIPMDISGKGPKGDGAMSKPHAIGAGLEYGRRDLIRMIFDLITGEEETLTNGALVEALEKISDAGDGEVLKHYYFEAFNAYQNNPEAIKAIQAAKIKRLKELAKK